MDWLLPSRPKTFLDTALLPCPRCHCFLLHSSYDLRIWSRHFRCAPLPVSSLCNGMLYLVVQSPHLILLFQHFSGCFYVFIFLNEF